MPHSLGDSVMRLATHPSADGRFLQIKLTLYAPLFLNHCVHLEVVVLDWASLLVAKTKRPKEVSYGSR